MPNDIGWDLYLLRRPDAPGAASIRLLVLIHRRLRFIRVGVRSSVARFPWDFPMKTRKRLMPRCDDWGSEVSMLLKNTRSRGGMDRVSIHETIFNGPDFVHAVGIYRGDGMAQLGPVDAATGLGGPAYSAQVVDDSDAMLAFLTEVLVWSCARIVPGRVRAPRVH